MRSAMCFLAIVLSAHVAAADPLATTAIDASVVNAVRRANHIVTLGHGMHVAASRAPDGESWPVASPAHAARGPAPVRPDGAEARWFVPTWSGVTLAASCTLGIQLAVSRDLRPSPTMRDSLAIGAGVVWQPGATRC